MATKEYNGLQVEFVSFGKDDLATYTYPPGWTNCEVSSVENYVTPYEGMETQVGTCWIWDDDDLIFNFYGVSKKVV